MIWNIVFYVFNTAFFSSVWGFILVFAVFLYFFAMGIKLMKGGY